MGQRWAKKYILTNPNGEKHIVYVGFNTGNIYSRTDLLRGKDNKSVEWDRPHIEPIEKLDLDITLEDGKFYIETMGIKTELQAEYVRK